MKALVKTNAAEGIWLEDVAEPEYGIDDVLIRVLKTGICGTDIHIYNWDAWAQKTIIPGTTIGHEFVGRRPGRTSHPAKRGHGRGIDGRNPQSGGGNRRAVAVARFLRTRRGAGAFEPVDGDTVTAPPLVARMNRKS